MNRINLPVFAVATIVFPEGQKQAEAIGAARNADHDFFIFFNKFVRGECGPEESFGTVHL